MQKILLFCVLNVFLTELVSAGDPENCTLAERCPSEGCGKPDCHCSGKDTGLPDAEKVQVIYLTFDDAFTAIAEEQFYHGLFDGTYTNPNGCAIRATHFITQQYNDYSLVNEYWHKGHEMAAHSITHRNDINRWKKMDKQTWKDEMVGIRKMIAQFANIPPCEIIGNRAPYLQGGGDAMFEMLYENNFKYDCSWPTRQFGYTNAMNGMYPYTLDYKTTQDCPIEPCPQCSYPGVWNQPMIDLEDEWIGSNPNCPECGNVCSMLDGCVILEDFTREHVFHMLMKNFERVYHGQTDDLGNFIKGNKAPWGLYMHAAWFFGGEETIYKYQGYTDFIKEITNSTKYPDVYIVPIEAGIRYMEMQIPKTVIENMGKADSSPFGCDSIEQKSGKYDPQLNPCGNGVSCQFQIPPDTAPWNEDGLQGERYMKMCPYITVNGQVTSQSCPEIGCYPWLGVESVCGNVCSGSEPCADCN